jgi:hypothetical protein
MKNASVIRSLTDSHLNTDYLFSALNYEVKAGGMATSVISMFCLA